MTPETIRQCVLLPGEEAVGRNGSREAADGAFPVALRQCGDRPFLGWSLREMQRFGIDDFVVVRHVTDDIERAVAALHDSLPKPAKITLCVAPGEAHTGDALRCARAYLHPRFLVCPADRVFSCNLSRFFAGVRTGSREGAGAWVLLREVEEAERFGRVELDDRSDRIAVFRPSGDVGADGAEARPGLGWSGFSVFDRSVLDRLTPGCSIERDILPRMAQAGELRGMVLEGFFRDIGSADEMDALGLELRARLLRPAVFLDRDGVINHDHGWVGTRERFEWEPDVLPTIARLTETGYHVFIVTNQSGIARGLYSEDDLKDLMGWVIDIVRAHGGTIDDWRYCPMHPEAALQAYRGESDWRKPAPGMILDLVRRWDLTPSRCVLFGDQETDLLAARAAGMEGVKVGPKTLAALVSIRAALQ